MDWDKLPLTRAVLVAAQPTLHEDDLHRRIEEVEETLLAIELFCEERGLTMPPSAIQVDQLTGEVEVVQDNALDTYRFNQIVFKLYQEQQHAHDDPGT